MQGSNYVLNDNHHVHITSEDQVLNLIHDSASKFGVEPLIPSLSQDTRL